MVLKYSTANEWRDAAMQRISDISETEIAQRRVMASKHYATEKVMPDADTLADHELYILGKMEMHEYEQYLLFKHHPNNQ